MITVSPEFKTEVFEKENRSFLYKAIITLASGPSITVENEYFSEAGGVSVDEAVSADNSLGIGSCIINKATLVLQNYDGHFDSYDFRGAGVVLYFGLNIDGDLEEYKRGTYIIKEMPVYDPATITLTCYDYMALLDGVLVADLDLDVTETISDVLDEMQYACDYTSSVGALPFMNTTIKVPQVDGMTCRELLFYIGQMNAVNFSFNEDGELVDTWYSSGYTSESMTIRALMDGAVRTVEDNVVRISFYQPEGEVVWNNREVIPALYTLSADRHDTVVTGVRIVMYSDNVDESIIDADTWISGSDEYMISVEGNPLITPTNADAVLAALAAALAGFKYRQATFSFPEIPWLQAGDTALITDAKGDRHTVLISSTTCTSLERQTAVSSGYPCQLNISTRFTPETKAFVRAMEEIKPVVNTINQRIANANGLYETDVPDGQATIRYLHNKANLAESDIQMVISDVGVLMTANGTDPSPTWYGLTVDGTLLANILSVSGVNADWIKTGAITVKDQDNNVLFQVSVTDKKMLLTDTGNSNPASFKIIHDVGTFIDTLTLFSNGLFYNRTDEEDNQEISHYFSNNGISLQYTDYPDPTDPTTYDYRRITLSPSGDVVRLVDASVVNNVTQSQYMTEVTAHNGIKINNEYVATMSTPEFTPSNGITVSQETWSKVGNIVTGDLTFRSSSTISSSTVTIGKLSEKPAHTVIGFIRTSSVVMRCSIDSSGNIKVNSPSNIGTTTDIMLTITFVAS